MKKWFAALAILLALFIAWSAWPFFALFDLARAVRTGDVPAIERGVDFVALRRSLLDQIAIAYAKSTGLRVDRGILGATATIAAEPLVSSLLTPQNLIEVMRIGWPKTMLAEQPPSGATVPNIGAPGNILRLYLAADYGIGSFRITLPLNEPTQRRFELRLELKRWRWRVTAFMLSPDLTERLVRELAKVRLTS